MRLLLSCLWTLLFTACASLSDRPTDLQPAIVLSGERTTPRTKDEGQWGECFDRALSAAPGLVPRMAQDCCLSSRADPDVLVWCQRHNSMLKSKNWDGDKDKDDVSAYYRWVREGFFCRFLRDQKSGGTMNVPVTDAEIAIQCRLSDVMGTHRPGRLGCT